MFFDTFKALCEKKGVSCKRATEDMGFSNSISTKWKKTAATPQGDTLNKIASYFGVTTDYLLGNEQKKSPVEKDTTDIDLKFALFGGADGITDEMYEEVKRFAKFVKERENEKK